MGPNPLLEKLGFSNSDRVAILHTDDIGMCQASVAAFVDLWDYGLISSGATMVPCPWFPQVAIYSRSNPEVDLGVHITLNSEWDTYRWAPISTADRTSGLIDEEGYFYRREDMVWESADPGAAGIEIRAQVDRAHAAGIDITHIDTHMGTVAHPKFIPAYLQTAIQAQVPPMIIRLDADGYRRMGLDASSAEFAAQWVSTLEADGLPLLDNLSSVDLSQPDNRLEATKKALSELPPGFTHFILHPSKDTPELRAITSDWPSRVADYQVFCDDRLRKFIQESGIQVVGYRAIRDNWRKG